jgi:hypothetical protein
MNKMERTDHSSLENIIIAVEVPTDNFYTWQSVTLLSTHPSAYEPSELTSQALENPVQSVHVTIPVDFLTLERLKLEFTLEDVDEKKLKKALTRYYECCNAKVQSISIPNNLW